jgi:S-adenosylmethionine hydrolase
MKIISLVTDFGLQDNFVGVMKAVILRVNALDIGARVKVMGRYYES